MEAANFDPLEADGALAFLAAFGALAPPAAGAATGMMTGTETGAMMGMAMGTALPMVAGAIVCAAATAMTATRKDSDLNIVFVCVVKFVADCRRFGFVRLCVSDYMVVLRSHFNFWHTSPK